jgi:outer membrane protein OmpA-like peptidoglycan-associated protein
VETAVVAVAEEEPVKEKPLPVFDKVFFAFDSYVLTREAEEYLQSIIPALQNEVPDHTLKLEGHASADGNPEYNKRLAYNRAKTVSDYLVRQGVAKNRIHIENCGISRPNEDNVNNLLPLDRRVEIKVEQSAK